MHKILLVAAHPDDEVLGWAERLPDMPILAIKSGC